MVCAKEIRIELVGERGGGMGGLRNVGNKKWSGIVGRGREGGINW